MSTEQLLEADADATEEVAAEKTEKQRRTEGRRQRAEAQSKRSNFMLRVQSDIAAAMVNRAEELGLDLDKMYPSCITVLFNVAIGLTGVAQPYATFEDFCVPLRTHWELLKGHADGEGTEELPT